MVPLASRSSQVGAASNFTCSAAAPLQSPQWMAFNAAVGRKDVPSARGMMATKVSGRASHTRHVGTKANAQGNKRGRLVGFVPINSTAESSERQTSGIRPELDR